MKDYKIKPGTTQNSDSVSLASSDGNEIIDLDAAANQHNVDDNLVEGELIKHEERKVEFTEGERDSVSQNDKDVLMSDAGEPEKITAMRGGIVLKIKVCGNSIGGQQLGYFSIW
ncbi:hypothetical protein O181_027813 [Austropuccinia psidii MF-1]|uniref:Uncharacterized protein n=1 Tax=Austropuccinia psidii MF-1 TaxID=1389203 RepID=A0A9Q3CSI4_9BASI|nr:hypothetical protein [Austropuccinia psidii MF-1]